MNSLTDQELLRDYAERRTEPAFAELVRRHVNLVYSAALRMVHDAHLAEDVTQRVFAALAQNARQLVDRPVLSGWLHRTAQNLAAKTVRTEVRRRVREQEAATMNELISNDSQAVWEQIAPHLDAALVELNEADRDAVLLRYFQRKSAQEMAQTLGISNEAAQKRVSRAVERLREFLAKRGVTAGAGGLVVVISANAVQSAPVGLATTITTSTIAGTTIAITATATKAIAMTTLQKTLIASMFAVVAGAGIYEASQASQLRERNQMFLQQQAPLTDQIQQLQRERDDATNRLASLAAENEVLKKSPSELLRLRGEVTHFKNNSQNPAWSKPASDQNETNIMDNGLLGVIAKLKQKLKEMPDKSIPEIKWLDDDAWLRIARGPMMNFETEADIRRALSMVRQTAKTSFARRLGQALDSEVKTNDGQLPTNLAQLLPSLNSQIDIASIQQRYGGRPGVNQPGNPPVDETTLQRYELLQAGRVDALQPDQTVIAEKATVDDQFDTLIQIAMNRYSIQGTGQNSGTHGSGYWDGGKSQAGLAAEADYQAFARSNMMRLLDLKLQPLQHTVTPDQLQAYRQMKIEEFERGEEAKKLYQSFFTK